MANPVKAEIAVKSEPIKAYILIDPKMAVTVVIKFAENASFKAGEVLRVQSKMSIKNIRWPLKIEIGEECAEVVIAEKEDE